MKIDAHQHFWHYSTEEYQWINDEMSPLQKDHMPENLEPLLKTVGFDGTVAVQARQTLKETEWLLGLADRHTYIKGVVGWMDLCSADIESQLGIFTKHPFMKGVRHGLQEENSAFREDFIRGVAVLQSFGLTFDLLVRPHQLATAIELVRLFPEQRFVLDHIAKPDIKNGTGFEDWKAKLGSLASAGNVYCKVSGMVTEADWSNWQETDFIPYLDFVFEAFGTEKIMIGSDWPVCTASSDYQSVMNIVIHYLQQYPPSVQQQVLGGNCIQFYNL